MNSSADPSYSRSIPSRLVLELKIGSLSLFPHTTLIISFFQRVLGSDTFGRQHCCPAVTDSPKTLPICRRLPTVSNRQTMQVFLIRAALTNRPLSVTQYTQTLVDKPEPESPNKFANCLFKKPHVSDVTFVKRPRSRPNRPCCCEYRPNSFVISILMEMILCQVRLAKQSWYLAFL